MTTIDAFPNSDSAIMRRDTTTESSQIERILWLQSLFGDGATDSDVGPLAGLMTEFFIPQGSILYAAGSKSDSLFFIVSGVIKQGERGHTHYVATEVVGFVDAMIDRPHVHTAEVIEDAVILRLQIDDWLEHLENDFDVLRKLIIGSLRNASAKPVFAPGDDIFTQALTHASDGEIASSPFVRRLIAMKASVLFHKASVQAIAQLVRQSRSVELAEGAVLTAADAPAGVWLLVTGEVTTTYLVDESERTISCPPATLMTGLRALTHIPSGFQVVATQPSELLHLCTEDYFDTMEDHFDLARSTLSYVAGQVERMNESQPRSTADFSPVSAAR